MVFSIVDIAMTDRARVRYLPKTVWIIFVIIASVLGSILWWTIGRERKGSARAKAAPLGPDDDPKFLDGVEQRRVNREQADRIRDLERQLAELDDDEQPKPEQ